MRVVTKKIKNVIIYCDDYKNNLFFRKMLFFHGLKLCEKNIFKKRSTSDIETTSATYALNGSLSIIVIIIIILLYGLSATTG